MAVTCGGPIGCARPDEDHTDASPRPGLRFARSAHERARFQRSQVARLRRRGLPVHTIPFQFAPELDLAAVRRIASHLAGTI